MERMAGNTIHGEKMKIHSAVDVSTDLVAAFIPNITVHSNEMTIHERRNMGEL